jgi:voltage-gated sodium channel
VTAYLQRLVGSRGFGRVVFAAILAAGVLAGLETNRELMARHGPLLHALDAGVLAVFAVEIACKLGAHGRRPWRFFRDGWNAFDFVVVALCLLPLHSPFAAVLRLARGLRVLRLVSALPRLQLLVGALLKSIGAMGHVCLLLALLFYIYAVAGVQLFAAHSPLLFGSLSLALFTLFRLMTLDNWSELFAAVDPHAPVAAPLYFFTFILIGTTIMLNLFIGIVMKSMTEVHDELERPRGAAAPAREPPLPAAGAELDALARQLEAAARSVDGLRARIAATGGGNPDGPRQDPSSPVVSGGAPAILRDTRSPV